MTTTSVSDPSGPLTEKGLQGLGPLTSPHHLVPQSSPSSMTWGAGSRPNAMNVPVLSESRYNQQHHYTSSHPCCHLQIVRSVGTSSSTAVLPMGPQPL